MPSRKRIVFPKRGEIFLVNFDPTIGSEIKKTRPAVILQNDSANQYSPVTIVAAVSSQMDERLYPTEVKLIPKESGLTVESVVLLNQIRTIDKQRLVKKLGQVKPETMKRIDRALLISCGLTDG